MIGGQVTLAINPDDPEFGHLTRVPDELDWMLYQKINEAESMGVNIDSLGDLLETSWYGVIMRGSGHGNMYEKQLAEYKEKVLIGI